MALTVNTNMAALGAANTLNQTQGSLSQTLSRVSSGLRVEKAADDAAGSAVATNLSTKARSGRQAMRNANDGISIIQTAEAATKEVVSILDRMRELAVQSASETLHDDERAYIDTEFEELSAEVERIAQATEFNDIALTNGDTSTMSVQVGISGGSASQIEITLGNLEADNLNVDTGTSGVDLSSASSAKTAISTIDNALDTVNGMRAELGASQNRLESSVNNMTAYVESLMSASSRIVDADYAHETAEMTRLQVMQQAGVAALGQARSMNTSVISLLG